MPHTFASFVWVRTTRQLRPNVDVVAKPTHRKVRAGWSTDQEEIHFEVKISPKSTVGGWPLAEDVVRSRVLGQPIVVDLATMFGRGYYRELEIPAELSPGRHVCTIHSNGAVSVPLVKAGVFHGQLKVTRPIDGLGSHLPKALCDRSRRSRARDNGSRRHSSFGRSCGRRVEVALA